MNVNSTQNCSKDEVMNSVADLLKEFGLTVSASDFTRPWGGFFVVDEKLSEKFIERFFPLMDVEKLIIKGGKLSPKILVVAPQKRLSWQYHHRRAEVWRLVAGEAAIVRSKTDQQGVSEKMFLGDTIELSQGERHRLVGLDNWGVVAEIWKHTDINYPSDEADIVRIEDDFGR